MSPRKLLKRASPQAVRAESPTLKPSSRVTITRPAAAPRWSGAAPAMTAALVGATVSPKPAPSTASCTAMSRYDVSPFHVKPIAT